MSKVSAYSSLVAPTSGMELYAIDSSGNSRKIQLEDALKEVGGGAPASGALLTYSTTTSTAEWLVGGTSGHVLTVVGGAPAWAAAPDRVPAAPTSGGVMTYSTTTSTTEGSKPTSGAVLVGSSIGVPTWTAAGAAGYLLQSTGSVPAWKSPIRYVSIPGFSSAGTMATGPCGYVQIPPDVNGYNLTYVSGFHHSSAGSVGQTEFNIVRERAGTSAVMLTSGVEIASGAICSSASASQAVIDATNDDVATGDILELHLKVIPSASAPKGVTAQLGFSLP